MIKPHPESDLSLNIMVLGSEIISYLNSNTNREKYVLVENILSGFLKKDKRRSPDLFIYTLVFLYSLGIIEQKGYKITLVPPKKEQQLNLLEYYADSTTL